MNRNKNEKRQMNCRLSSFAQESRVAFRNAFFIGDETFGTHVQVIFVTQCSESMHHFAGMVDIDCLLVFPLIDEQDRLRIIQ